MLCQAAQPQLSKTFRVPFDKREGVVKQHFAVALL